MEDTILSYWILSEEKLNGLRDEPDSFDTTTDIESIRLMVNELLSMVEEDNLKDAEGLASDIDSLLNDCEISSCEFQEWGSGWRDVAQEHQNKLKDMLDNLKIEYSKTVKGESLIDWGYQDYDYGNGRFKDLIRNYFRDDRFEVLCTGHPPHHIKGQLHIMNNGLVSLYGESLTIDFNDFRVCGTDFKIDDYFIYWWQPTQEEADYFEMITGKHYWIRDLFVKSEKGKVKNK